MFLNVFEVYSLAYVIQKYAAAVNSSTSWESLKGAVGLGAQIAAEGGFTGATIGLRLGLGFGSGIGFGDVVGVVVDVVFGVVGVVIVS